MLLEIFTLLVLYQAKHFLSDYPFQTPYMLQKFKPGWDFLGPLALHCGVHGLGTFLILVFWKAVKAPELDPSLLVGLPILDFCVHFAMDRIKAGPKYLGRYKALAGSEFIQIGKDVAKAKKMKNARAKGKIFAEIALKLKGNTYFWWSLGFDQMVHHLTHYYIIYRIVTG